MNLKNFSGQQKFFLKFSTRLVYFTAYTNGLESLKTFLLFL